MGYSQKHVEPGTFLSLGDRRLWIGIECRPGEKVVAGMLIKDLQLLDNRFGMCELLMAGIKPSSQEDTANERNTGSDEGLSDGPLGKPF